MSSDQTGSPADSEAPKFQADNQLRAFRQEAQLSWQDFNTFWMNICNYLNSPAYDLLLDVGRANEVEYSQKLCDITIDLLSAGLFGSGRHGTWRYGQYSNEPDLLP